MTTVTNYHILNNILIVKKALIFVCFLFLSGVLAGQVRTVHVFVALCDNIHQGIIPVPAKLGNGQDPVNNLYWGAAYGVKSYFRYKTNEWEVLATLRSHNPEILDRVLFRHVTEDVYMLADAYDGAKIKSCVENFLKASNGQQPEEVLFHSIRLNFGGGSDLIAYVGHDGLMDFNVDVPYKTGINNGKEVMILACISREYFAPEILRAGALPLLWTTGLMAPEAYTLKAALDGWMLKESGNEIAERAARAYNQYQKCGLRGARNLFATGF